METRASYQDLTFKRLVSNQIDISMLRTLFSSLNQTCEQVAFFGKLLVLYQNMSRVFKALYGVFPDLLEFLFEIRTPPSVECVLTYKVNVTVENHFAGSRLTPTTSTLLFDFNIYRRLK